MTKPTDWVRAQCLVDDRRLIASQFYVQERYIPEFEAKFRHHHPTCKVVVEPVVTHVNFDKPGMAIIGEPVSSPIIVDDLHVVVTCVDVPEFSQERLPRQSSGLTSELFKVRGFLRNLVFTRRQFAVWQDQLSLIVVESKERYDSFMREWQSRQGRRH